MGVRFPYRLYHVQLKICPPGFRDEYGDEMTRL